MMIRSERNRYKEESRQLGSKLDSVSQELAAVNRDREQLRSQLQQQQQVQSPTLSPGNNRVSTCDRAQDTADLSAITDVVCQQQQQAVVAEASESADSGLHQHSLDARSSSVGAGELEGGDRLSRFLDDVARSSSADEQASMLKFRLDEALKTIEAERKYVFFTLLVKCMFYCIVAKFLG